MSLSRVRNVVAIAAVLLMVAACGYRPLYGPSSTNARVEGQLAGVSIKPIADRVGQMMHTELSRRLNPGGQAARPSHSLAVTLSESVQHLAVERDTFATRANLTVTARYVLVRTVDSVLVEEGSDSVVASYNLLSSDYATLVAEKDARKRAVGELAEQLRNRIAIYFHGPGAGEPLADTKTDAAKEGEPQ